MSELRPGIGLCDGCGEPKHPQRYAGYGMMLCDECFESVPEPSEEHCADCGQLFRPLALPRPHIRCPECAAKRAEQGEAL